MKRYEKKFQNSQDGSDTTLEDSRQPWQHERNLYRAWTGAAVARFWQHASSSYHGGLQLPRFEHFASTKHGLVPRRIHIFLNLGFG